MAQRLRKFEPSVAGRKLEAVPAEVLPGRMAGDGERAGPGRRDLHYLALPNEGAGAAAAC